MICPRCGVNISDERKNCYNCGYSFVPEVKQDNKPKSKKIFIIGISVVVLLIIIGMIIPVALVYFDVIDIGLKPALSIVSIEGEDRVEVSGETDYRIDMEIENTGSIDAKSEKIMISIKNNVGEKYFDWTGWDIKSDSRQRGSFNIKINRDTFEVNIVLYYDGEKLDEATLLLTILSLPH